MQNSTPTPKSYEQLSRDYLDLASFTHSCISDLGSMLYAIQILDDEKHRFVQKKLMKIGGYLADIWSDDVDQMREAFEEEEQS